MSRIVTGHWLSDAGDVYIPCGFVPDFLFAMNFSTSTELIYYWWGAEMEAHETTAGVADDGAGALSKMTEAAGFNGYDTGVQGPYGDVSAAAVIADWVASTASWQARSATTHGDYVHATSTGVDDLGLIVDRSAIFECVTAGTSGATEPTWPSVIGGQVLDSTPVWEKVTDVATFAGGYQGFTVAAALMTDGEEWYYMAIRSDDTIDHGDTTAWPGGIKGM